MAKSGRFFEFFNALTRAHAAAGNPWIPSKRLRNERGTGGVTFEKVVYRARWDR